MHILEKTFFDRNVGFELKDFYRDRFDNREMLHQRSHTDSKMYRWFMKVKFRRQNLDCPKIAANACCRRNPRDRSANRLAG